MNWGHLAASSPVITNEITNENYAQIGMFLTASCTLPRWLSSSTFLP